MKKVSTIIMLALAFALVASTTSAAEYTFTKTLKSGSRGADVVALQTILESKSLLTMPAGVAKGYFGELTVSAVKAYQTSKGISAVGQVGPATRAALKLEGATVSGSTVPGCAAGALFSATTGAACTTTGTGGTTATTGITTPGVEGTLTVSAGPVANTNVYVGDSKVQVLNLKLQAQNSDIAVQRVQVDLGDDSAAYTKAFSTIYVVGDNGSVLGSTPLNLSTVVKSTDPNGLVHYYVTVSGFNYIVSKNASRFLTVAVDVYSSVDSAYRSPTKNYTISLASQGVRGVDGAGIVQYTTGTASQLVLIQSSLSDSADIKLSTNGATPAAGAVVANSGSTNDQADKVTVLVFDMKAEKDSIGITDLKATTTLTVGSTTGAYLYDGSTLVASAAVISNRAIFSNIGGTTGYVIPKDTTKTFTLQVDIRNASTTHGNLSAQIIATDVSAQNSQGTSLGVTAITGNAGSNTLTVQKAGPVFALVGTPMLSKSPISTASASSTFATGFTFSVAAKGTNVTIASTSAFVIGVYANGTKVATSSAVYSRPVTGTTLDTNGDYVVADGQAATFTAQTSFVGPNATYPAGQIFTARLESVNGGNTYLSETFRAESPLTTF